MLLSRVSSSQVLWQTDRQTHTHTHTHTPHTERERERERERHTEDWGVNNIIPFFKDIKLLKMQQLIIQYIHWLASCISGSVFSKPKWLYTRSILVSRIRALFPSSSASRNYLTVKIDNNCSTHNINHKCVN